jgi:8-oxo-dGTP pyrophosphatase MutT (NUDIX family)
MHRTDLLNKLRAYTPASQRDEGYLQAFTSFVEDEPHCFERTLEVGHVTASAWMLDPTRTQVLLTHHRKLHAWLQPGGHCDGNPDTLGTALREAREESGIADIIALSEQIFDLDIHAIPATPNFPAHLHYDVRYILQARSTAFTVSEESFDLTWADLSTLERFTQDESVLRMRDKWLALSFALTPVLAPQAQ